MRAGSFADGWVNMARFWAALFAADKSFAIGDSTLGPIVRLISGGAPQSGQNFTTAQLQEELDKLPVDKAKKYKDALKILVDDYADVCYTGVEDFKPREVSRPINVRVQPNNTDWKWGNPQVSSGKVMWNSALFDLKAKVYQIVPTPGNRFEIGFVQHCTRKENKGTYSDNGVVSDHPTQPPPWGDTGQNSTPPWYTSGMHNGQLAYAKMAAGINTVDYGMDDSFDDRGHPYTSLKSGNPTVVAGSKLNSLDCAQDFTTWLVRNDSTTGTKRLLRKVSYSITGKFTVGAQNQVGGAKTGVAIRPVEKPQFADALPNTNTQTMNNNERWFRGAVQI